MTEAKASGAKTFFNIILTMASSLLCGVLFRSGKIIPSMILLALSAAFFSFVTFRSGPVFPILSLAVCAGLYFAVYPGGRTILIILLAISFTSGSVLGLMKKKNEDTFLSFSLFSLTVFVMFCAAALYFAMSYYGSLEATSRVISEQVRTFAARFDSLMTEADIGISISSAAKSLADTVIVFIPAVILIASVVISWLTHIFSVLLSKTDSEYGSAFSEKSAAPKWIGISFILLSVISFFGGFGESGLWHYILFNINASLSAVFFGEGIKTLSGRISSRSNPSGKILTVIFYAVFFMFLSSICVMIVTCLGVFRSLKSKRLNSAN